MLIHKSLYAAIRSRFMCKGKRNQSRYPQQVNRLPNCAAHLWNTVQQCDTQTTWMNLQGTALNGEGSNGV